MEKYACQIASSPQVRVKINTILNHHLVIYLVLLWDQISRICPKTRPSRDADPSPSHLNFSFGSGVLKVRFAIF